MRVFIVAGELSGDLLGAALIDALRQRVPVLDVRGVAGPAMQAAGCQPLANVEALSLMGIAEVLPALPRLFRLRAALIDEALRFAPDVVVGIDAPDFNLGLERRLRERGLRCVHLVSPTIWAWRKGRLKTIARSVDQMLCLFPFEPAHYAGSGVEAAFIGHPLADQLDDATSPSAGRAALGLAERPTLAVLPGSRGGEVRHLMRPFAQAAALLARERPDVQVITPIAKPSLRAPIGAAIQALAPQVSWRCLDGGSRAALRAADAVLLASGTATLETLLLGRPMVVAYRTSPVTAWLLLKAGLLKTRYVSLPNLLATEPTVPERLQDACTPQQLRDDLLPLLVDPAARRRQLDRFADVRAQLALDAGQRAADAILAGLQR